MLKRRLLPWLALISILLAACAGAGTTTPVIEATNPPPTVMIAPVQTREQPASPLPTEAGAQKQTETQQPAVQAVVIPDPGSYTWAPVASGIERPTDIQPARDGSGRLFILEQAGRIRILKDGQLLQKPFLDIKERVGSNGSEQGLLGLAFHPNFSQNGYFFVNYTDLNGNTHIARFTSNGDAADAGSEKQLLLVQQPFPNHNGGALAFDPAGKLVIGLGDGGSGGDPYGNGQSKNTLLGKLLRLDVDSGEPYAIPADNPFASGGGRPEIWALGLRNPWRFSFDRTNSNLWIADVGQNQWEEIDFVPAGTPGGLNFGWNKMEGMHAFKGGNQPGFTAPVAEYSHQAGCSVSGGYVYRGSALPAWQGVYFFGDYCSGTIWGLPSPPNGSEAVQLFQTDFRITTFGQDEAGELYAADYGGGKIYRLEKRP